MSEIVCYYKQYDTLDKVTLDLNFLHKFVFYHFQDKPINLTVEIIRTAIIEINTKKAHILGINFWSKPKHIIYLLSNSSPKQCLLFSSGERVFQTGRAPRHLLLNMSAQCNIWNKNFLHFSPLHTDSFALTFIGSEFGKMHVHVFFSSTCWIFNNSRRF